MAIRKKLNDSHIGRKINGSVVGQWFQDFTEKVSDFITSESYKQQIAWKQGILDLMAHVESPEYQAELAWVKDVVNQRARRNHFLAIGRPDLALPHIYSTRDKEPLETRMNETLIANLYRI